MMSLVTTVLLPVFPDDLDTMPGSCNTFYSVPDIVTSYNHVVTRDTIVVIFGHT